MDKNIMKPVNLNNQSNQSNQSNLKELNEDEIKSFQSMIIFNDNLRKNIKLSLVIYKKLNNFEHKYIHQVLNDEK